MTLKLRAVPSVAGSIHFPSDVSEEELVRTLGRLADRADLERMRDLHLRMGGSDGTHIIAFHYEMRKGTKREQRSITESILAIVRASLGLHKRDIRFSMSTVLATV